MISTLLGIPTDGGAGAQGAGRGRQHAWLLRLLGERHPLQQVGYLISRLLCVRAVDCLPRP
jgi:hypothetical protein